MLELRERAAAPAPDRPRFTIRSHSSGSQRSSEAGAWSVVSLATGRTGTATACSWRLSGPGPDSRVGSCLAVSAVLLLRRCYSAACTTSTKMGMLGKRNALTGLAAVGSAVALAACGSSQKPSSPTASGTPSKALALANCMRAHGVPNFPDPTDGGGGVNLAGTGINPQSPAFKSARQVCAKLAPAAGPGGARATESQFLAALSFAKCMRAHDFPDFPDPTRSDSPPGPILIIGPGLFFRVSPSFDPNTPAVVDSVAACGGH